MRRFLLLLAALLAGATVAVALSPYWLGAVLPSVARRLDATYTTYERSGYARFVLTNVTVRRPGVAVECARMEADTPWLWAVRHLFGRDRAVSATSWSVDVRPSGQPRRAGPPGGWVPLQAQLQRIAGSLDRWLPEAAVGSGAVRWPGSELRLMSARWSKRTLDVSRLEWRERVADAHAHFGTEGAVELRLRGHSHPVQLSAKAVGAVVEASVEAWGQRAPLRAEFGETGWVPRAAKLEARDWALSGSDLRLPAYASLRGTAVAAWSTDHFDVQIDVFGQPRERGMPIRVQAAASGTPREWVVQRLDASTPAINAQLTEPLRLNFLNPGGGASSRFHFGVDLAKLPELGLTGRMEGEVDVVPRAKGWPQIRYTARALQVTRGAWRVEAVRAGGTLDWPMLHVDEAEVLGDGQARVTSTGSIHLLRREFDHLRVEGRIPFSLAQAFLPSSVVFRTADVVVQASGPWSEVRHEGTVRVLDLQARGFEPAAARVWWRGSGPTVDEIEAGVQAGRTEIVASGRLTPDAAELRSLTWRQNEEIRLALDRPATVRWRPGVAVDAFDLVGPAGELRVSGNWGAEGQLKFFARGIEAAWWRDFAPRLPFTWSIDRLFVEGSWDDGTARLNSSGKATLLMEGQPPLEVDFAAHSDGKTVTIDSLRSLEREREFATLAGRLPIAFTAAPRPSVTIDPEGEVALRGAVRPDARGWMELARRTGLDLEHPQLSLEIGGTWSRPVGSAQFSARRLQFHRPDAKFRMPRIEGLRFAIAADARQLRLEPLEARIEDQLITLTGRMPLGEGAWTELRRDAQGFILREGEVALRASQVQLAAFAPYLSQFLIPQGTVDADVSLSAHGPWKGFIRVDGVATRPLASLGPLREIRAHLRAEGRRVRVETVEGLVGGEPMRIAGTVEIPSGGVAAYDLSATGENLPFVRQSGMIVRGNVALKVSSTPRRRQPTLSGEVELRDSLFLSDVRSLVPNGSAGPERRPPYFSVTQAPFDRWRLDVNVKGDRFFRARTTLFNGIASMKLKLSGTLGEPRAVGDIRIDEGQVLFPFARFNLGDATVRLTEENPYEPQLAVFGASRRYGYDLNLELTGPASAPNLVFTSNPPLTSEQVLLLVMAGEAPQEEVSYSTTQRFARLGTYFGQSLLGSLGGGEGGDRLTISSGERISRQGRETYDVEYEMGRKWSLVGQYDEFDEYNIGLKRRILPREDRRDANDD